MAGQQSTIREALLQEIVGNKIRCNTCERRCVIPDGGSGWCRTRENRGGRLVTLIYGLVSSLSANPIEKKPLYHFHPGTVALTAGSWSCNFDCPWCQNWHISKTPPSGAGRTMFPDPFIKLARDTGCRGTSISFNEPTLSLEWSLDVFRLAREYGLYNTYVTNGYMTREALFLLIDAGLDAMNIDVKGDAPTVKTYCKGVDVEKVWDTCRVAHAHGVHVEITTLVIPAINDSPDTLRLIADRIVTGLGPEVPWHISGYHPAYRFDAPPTPVKTLERAWQIGKDAGLEYVYVGNVPGHRYDNTHCPDCGALLIRRQGFDVLHNRVRKGQCYQCQRPVAGVWRGSDR